MANVQTDFLTGNGPFVSRATDAAANAAATVTLPAPVAGKIRIHKIVASCSGAAAAADGTIVVKLDNSATNFNYVLAAARGPLANLDFQSKQLVGKEATAVPVILSALGAAAIGELEVVWDISG